MKNIKENNDVVIVKVNNRKINKCLNNHNGVVCFDTLPNIDKKIRYIISDFYCDKKIHVVCLNKNISIEFIKCYFDNEVIIENSDISVYNCIFDSKLFVYYSDAKFFSSIINDDLIAMDNDIKFNGFNLIKGDKTILKRNNLVLLQNEILSKELYLIKNISVCSVLNKVNSFTFIESKKKFDLSDYSIGVYNGIDINTFCLNESNTELINKRKELINVLNELKYKLLDYNNEEKENISLKVECNKLSKVLIK